MEDAEKKTQNNPVQPPDYSQAAKQPVQNTQETSYLSQAAHPTICIFTFIFKVTAIVFYFFLNLMMNNATFTFVVILLVSCADFWVVKNVTGRFLVKLRWWSEIQENGDEKWRFECIEDGTQPNKIDSSFFWFSQIGATIFWAVFSFINLISFSFFWGTLNIINFVLYGVNFMGYYKCRGEHQKVMKNSIAKIGLQAFSNAL